MVLKTVPKSTATQQVVSYVQLRGLFLNVLTVIIADKTIEIKRIISQEINEPWLYLVIEVSEVLHKGFL